MIRTFKERLFTEIFPGRTTVPKTLIFAKDDSHAEDIVEIVRQEFGKGNEFARKVTYRTTDGDPDVLLGLYRNCNEWITSPALAAKETNLLLGARMMIVVARPLTSRIINRSFEPFKTLRTSPWPTP